MLSDELKMENKSVLIAHFADLLKYICKTFFEWNGEKDEYGRAILQIVGTDVIRAQEPDFWVDFIIKIISLFDGFWDYVLIPDCRFPNEYEKFKELGYDTTLIRIERPSFESSLTDEQKFHKSETALDGYRYDYIIKADTMNQLYINAVAYAQIL